MSYTPFPDLTEDSLKSITLREEDVIHLKRLKNVLVRSQLYAEAAYLRDLEKRIVEILSVMAENGYKGKPFPQEEEKVYSISEVTTMLNLATAPLKKSLMHYEEFSRDAIVNHVAGLIKQNNELRKNQQAPSETEQITPVSDKEIMEDLKNQRMERAISVELHDTPSKKIKIG